MCKPDHKELKVLLLEQLPRVCSQEQYEQCLKQLGEDKYLPKRSVIKQRYQCFEAVLNHITQFSNCRQQIDKVQQDLQLIVQKYFTYQRAMTNNNSTHYQHPHQYQPPKINPVLPQKNDSHFIQANDDKPICETNNIIQNSQIIDQGNKSHIKQTNLQIQSILEKSFQRNQVKNQLINDEPNQKKEDINYQSQNKSKSFTQQNNSTKNPSHLSHIKHKILDQVQKKSTVLQKSFDRISVGEKSAEKEKSKIGITGKIIRYDNIAQASPLQNSFDKIRENVSEVTPAGSVFLQRNLSQINKNKKYQPPFKNNFVCENDWTQEKNTSNLSHKNYEKKKMDISQKRDLNIEEIRKNIQQLEQSKEQQESQYMEQYQQAQKYLGRSFQKGNSNISSVIQENDHFTFEKPVEEHNYSRNLILNVRDGKAIRSCQWSISGDLFAVGTNSSVVRVYKCLKPIYAIEGIHSKSVFSVDWSHNQNALVTCSNDQSVRLTSFEREFKAHKTTVIGQHESCVRMALFNGNESKIYSCGDDSVIKIWDIVQGKKAVVMKAQSPIAAMSMRADGLYSVGKDDVKMWDERSGKCVQTTKLQSELTCLVAHSDKVVCAHKDGQVSFLSPELQYLHSIQIHEDEIRSINSMSTPAKEELYITGSFDGHVAIFGESTAHNPIYFKHNQQEEDKVVYATFMKGNLGYASTSTLGHCNVYALL